MKQTIQKETCCLDMTPETMAVMKHPAASKVTHEQVR